MVGSGCRFVDRMGPHVFLTLTPSTSSPMLPCSTLVTVLFTTLVFGVLTKPLMAVLLDERLDHPLLKVVAAWLNKVLR